METRFPDLDRVTRHWMLVELADDVSAQTLYFSPDLSERGRAEYLYLLRTALETGTDASLADDLGKLQRVIPVRGLRRPEADESVETRRAVVARALAQDEFHRFYARGVCRHALAQGLQTLIIYRARPAAPGRSSGDAMIGMRIDASSLLEDLRASPDLHRPSGLPAHRSSGLSVRLR
jgi:hypothetical protein